MPAPGTEWYTICGTSYIDMESGRDTYAEYVMLICGVCLLGMYVFTAILAYPRTLFDIIFDCAWPKYYKIHAHPGLRGSVKRIIRKSVTGGEGDDAIDEDKYLIEHDDGTSEWMEKSSLVSDGVGPMYGERGGLYGLHGIHGETSTRERLRTFNSYNNAIERIKMWKKQK
jgi:hypothetical protein